jgi:hypothetical protein
MEIEVEYITKQKQTINVEFPIYRKVASDGLANEIVTYSKVFPVSGGKYREIAIDFERYGEQQTVSVTDETKDFTVAAGGFDYELGRGKYSCTKEEWENAAARARDFFAGALF